MKTSSSRDAAVDGLRGCAILLVLSDHFGVTQPGDFPWGVVGVRLFLLLSGCYLMRRIYAMHPECEPDEEKRVSLLQFYGSRFGRLIPVCYGALILAALTGIGFSRSEWLWHAFFATNFLAIFKGNWPETFSHFWSLSLQIQFYLLLPLLFLNLPRRAFGPLLLLGFLAAPAYRALCLGLDAPLMLRWFFPLSCLDAFAAGAFIIYLEKERKILLLRLQNSLEIGMIFAVGAMAAAYAMRMSCSNRLFVAGMESGESLLLFFILLWVRTRQHSYANQLLRFRPLAWIGVASYSLYAFHPWVHECFMAEIAPRLQSWGVSGNWQLLPLSLTVAAVAALSWKTLEQPWCSSACTEAFHRLAGIAGSWTESLASRFAIFPAARITAGLALAMLLAAAWIFRDSPPAPSLSNVPEEIQELQTELQTGDQEETSIISQEPGDWEPISTELQEYMEEEDFKLTL